MSIDQNIKIAISPCPNDTFIFGAWLIGLLNKRSTIKLSETSFMDISELNEYALTGEPDIVKVSAVRVGQLSDKYYILNCGGALGEDCGPILVSAHEQKPQDFSLMKVVLPGKKTTAHILFQDAYPAVHRLTYALFSEIDSLVAAKKFDAGVLIHEGRFTYRKKKLHLWSDLGELWVKKYELPIPLGLILVKKELGVEFARRVSDQIKQSIEVARTHPVLLKEYIALHAQEMDQEVIQNHIDLYVNEMSWDMGPRGRAAVEELLRIANELPAGGNRLEFI
ncbi:MAG: 1,4-dihydroxy-6-naphthoate synthase [Saprospiraceae bacterium]|nr:1,4-dihydroxy-6-naphthoate synthase [Saprospiraceae bacterium]MBK7796967.1 1,4-dihydroxy-6-naphthoate synthase [Saprospiraceae bacterium]MBK8152228.1 1,4-dihydroxy-6-naphthoate synthase [Saprospiraceae bacterium]MBK9377560.1 1,4-dihydroxy-6-naphthoate synthase [Saprospiraceae bacterium]MBL0259641.1 1,4-dihydroxy-6-naphthoate synthase [Saprospiraceae bacterium]